MNFLIPVLIFGIAGWWISHFLTRQAISIAHEKGILAHPNARSSHTKPTPRIGGLGPVCAILILFPFAMTVYPQIQEWQGYIDIDRVELRHSLGVILTLIAAALLGFMDDLGKLKARPKFFFQWSVAILPLLFGLRIEEIALPGIGSFVLHPILSLIISWMWVLLMMNVVNFMDGINGLAGRFLEIFGICLVVCPLYLSFRGEISLIGGIIIGASAGFLHFNLDNAKTFLGDTGSQAIGAFVAVMALFVHQQDMPYPSDPILPFMIVAFPLIFDVILTLIRRALAGKNLFEAHREHLYQRYLVCTNGDHTQTLHFVSNQLYVSVVAAILVFRPNSFNHGNRIALVSIGVVLAVSLYSWYRVLRMENKTSLENPQ